MSLVSMDSCSRFKCNFRHLTSLFEDCSANDLRKLQAYYYFINVAVFILLLIALFCNATSCRSPDHPVGVKFRDNDWLTVCTFLYMAQPNWPDILDITLHICFNSNRGCGCVTLHWQFSELSNIIPESNQHRNCNLIKL